MRYRLNEKPRKSVTPILEPIYPGTTSLAYVGLYKNTTVLHFPQIEGHDCILLLTDAQGPLASWTPPQLEYLAEKIRVPLDELKELHDLEHAYRQRCGT